MVELQPNYQVLNESEFANLPDNLKSKLIDELRISNDTVKDLRAEYDRSTVELEQQVFDLQEQLNVSVSQIDSLSSSNSTLKDTLKTAEQDCAARLVELQKLQTDHESCGMKETMLKRTNALLTEEKEDLLGVLGQRNEQIKSLGDEIKQFNAQIHSLTVAKCDLQMKIDDYESKELSSDFKEKRWNQEKELMENERLWLKDELNRREQQSLDLRQDLSSLNLDHQTEKEELANQNRELKMNLEEEVARRQRQEKELADLTERLREAVQQRETDEEKFEKELSTRAKLAQLYKRSANEAEHKIEELTKAIEQLQNLFSETKDSHIALQEHCKLLEEDYLDRLREKDNEVAELKEEVAKANELLHSKTRIPLTDEALYDLSPGAAAASRLMKSGLTLSAIYKDHCRVVEQLAVSQQEYKRLESCFQDLVEDIRIKAPALKRTKSDYLEAQEVIGNLKSQLTKVDQDQQRMLNDRDEYYRKWSYARAEVEKYQRDNSDLSTQVRQLLRTVEDMRAGGALPSPSADRSFLNRSASSDSAEDLILFRNIDELQLQNQRLLSELNTAKAMRDEMVKAAQAEEIQSIQRELKHTLEELASLREHKDKQKEMIEAMAKQRDKYKEMLHTQSVTAEILSPPKRGVSQSSPPLDPSEDAAGEIGKSQSRQSSPGGDVSSSGAVALLNKEFEVYRNEHQATEKLLSEKIEKLESVVKELRNKNAKLNSEVEYQEEKFKAMLSNAETYKKEIVQLRDRNERTACVVAKHEQNIINLSKELTSQKEAETRARVENRHLTDKNQTLDSAIGRYKAEIEILNRDTVQQRQLMLTLQDLQTRLDRKEAEQTMKQDDSRERLGKERDALQRTVQTLTEQHNEYIKSLKFKLTEKENKLDEVQIAMNAQSTELAMAKSSAEELVTKNEKLETELKQMSESYNETSIDRLQKEVHVWQSQLNYAQASATDLKKKLEDTELEAARLRAENERLRELSEALESNMKSFKETEIEETSALKQQLDEALKNYGRVQSESDELEQKCKKLEMELAEIKCQDAEKQGSINAQLRTLQDSLADMSQSLEEAQQRERDLKKDLDAQVGQTREFQNKFNLEIESHNKIGRELTDVQGELRLVKEQIGESEDSARRANNHMETLKRECEQKIQLSEAVGEEHLKKIEDLKEKNAKLFEDVEKFMNQVAYLEKMQQNATAASEAGGMEIVKQEDESNEADGQSSMSVENASQVLKYLKEEKRSALAKLTETEKENAEMKAQFAVMDSQIAEMRTELGEAKRDSEILTEVTREKQTLLSKLEAMTSLQASNQSLMTERNSYIEQLNNCGTAMNTLKEDIATLEKEKEHLKCLNDNYKDMMDQANVEIERWKRQHDELMEQRAQFDPEQLHKLQTDLVSLQKEFKTEKTANISLQKETEDLKAKVVAQESKISSSAAAIEKHLSEKTQIRSLAQKYRDKCNQLETAAKEQEVQQEKLNQENAALKQSVKEIGDERDALGNQLKEDEKKQEQPAGCSEGHSEEIKQLKALLTDSATKTNEAVTRSMDYRQQMDKLSTENEEWAFRLKALSSQFDSTKEKLRKAEEDKTTLTLKLQQRVRATGMLRPPSAAERQPPVRVQPNVRPHATVEDSSSAIMQGSAGDASSSSIVSINVTTTTSSSSSDAPIAMPHATPQVAHAIAGASGPLQPQAAASGPISSGPPAVAQPSSLLPRAIIPPLQSGGSSSAVSGTASGLGGPTRTTVAVQPTNISPGPGAISQSDQRSSSPMPGPSQIVHPMVVVASSGASTSAVVTGQYHVTTSSVPQAVVSPHVESQDIVSGSADNGGTISSSSSVPNFANDHPPGASSSSTFGGGSGNAMFGAGSAMSSAAQFAALGSTSSGNSNSSSINEPSTSSEAMAGRKRGHSAAGVVSGNQANKRVCSSSPAELVAPDQSSSVFQHLSSSAQPMRSHESQQNLVADITSSNQREEDDGGMMMMMMMEEEEELNAGEGGGHEEDGSEEGDSDDSDVVVILSDDEEEEQRGPAAGSAPPASIGQPQQPTRGVAPVFAVESPAGHPIPVLAPAPRPSLQPFHPMQPDEDDGMVPRTPIVTTFAQSSEHDAPFVPQASGLFPMDAQQQQQPPTSSSVVPVIIRPEAAAVFGGSGFPAGAGLSSGPPPHVVAPPITTAFTMAAGTAMFGSSAAAAGSSIGGFGRPGFGQPIGMAMVDVSSGSGTGDGGDVGAASSNFGGSSSNNEAVSGWSSGAMFEHSGAPGAVGGSVADAPQMHHQQQQGAMFGTGGIGGVVGQQQQQPAPPQRAVFAVTPRVIVTGSGNNESAEPASSSDEAGPAAEPDDAQLLPAGEDLWTEATGMGDDGGSMEASQSAQVEGTFEGEEFDDSSEATAFQTGMDSGAAGDGPSVDDDDSNGPTTSDDQHRPGTVKVRKPITFDLDEGASSSSGAPSLLSAPVQPPIRGTARVLRRRPPYRGPSSSFRGLFGQSSSGYGQYRATGRGGQRRL